MAVIDTLDALDFMVKAAFGAAPVYEHELQFVLQSAPRVQRRADEELCSDRIDNFGS